MRGRGNNNHSRKGGNSRNHSYESNGPDVKVRGNAQQVVEKYLTLARDASSAGDRINAESYYQFAEHYYRIMTANAANEQQQRQQQNVENESSVEAVSEIAGTGNSKHEETSDGAQEEHSNSQGNVSAEVSDRGNNENGRSRRRSSRRGNGHQKDPVDQPQPELANAAEGGSQSEQKTETGAEDTGEGVNA
jgi:hypothetical protein